MSLGTLLSLIAIGFLLVLSAILSATETAMTAASRPRLRHLAQEGDRRAKIAEAVLDARERFLGSILFSNNMVNILATALASGILIAFFGDAGVAYATVIMTVVVVLFGEILPKTYALRHPTQTAVVMARFSRVLMVVVSPVVVLGTLLIGLILRLLPERRRTLVTPQEELRSAIQIHADQGALVKRERDMLHGVIDLAETTVEDVMVHRRNMVLLDADLPRRELVTKILECPHTRVPLWRREPENIVGVLHVRDLLRAMAERRGDIDTLDLEAIIGKPWFVPMTTRLIEQLAAFRSQKSHFALVVDEYGALMGLVTLQDILDEVVGPIADDFGVAQGGMRQQPDGSVIVDGTVTIRDLNRDLGWNLPDEEAVTVAGLVLHESRSIPDVGQVFLFYDTRFEVLRRQRNQITLLRLSRVTATQAAAS
ncbi:MAG: HlyC/CorC family transporter [Alphaproteobacteria bacterium]|nr:HlyC/CorC family transporter [Alphaproteobacteria bacterium]